MPLEGTFSPANRMTPINANQAYPAQGAPSWHQDYSKYPGLAIRDLEIFLEDARYQPNWRLQAEREADYYDGNQLESDWLAELEERGMAPLITNLIQPTINAVLGMEAKTRTDWTVRPDNVGDKQSDDVALALREKLHEAERMSRADRAVSDAYGAQIKVGMAWVEVARESDPFKEPYRLKYVHRREIWWDWRSQEPDLSDARYLFRRKWYDKDALIAMFPSYSEMIDNAAGGWPSFEPSRITESGLYRDWEIERDSSIEDIEWRDAERERLALYEVWYRLWIRGIVLRFEDGRVIEYDEMNQKHNEMIVTTEVKPIEAVYTKVRLSWWVGPHRIHDIPTPYTHNMFPYVPFFGYREDRTNVPYGLIRAMKSPQDEVNARRQKMMWLLSAKRVITDEDAVAGNRHNDVQQEVSRPDAYIILNPARKNADGFKVESDFELSKQQFMVMQENKGAIQDAGGVYQQMLGKTGGTTQGGKPGVGAAMSGIAINQLIEQGTTTLAEINDNYRFARRCVGDMLLKLINEDLAGHDDLTVAVKQPRNRIRKIILNQVGQENISGNKLRTNDTVLIKTRVELEDVPSTPTYRQQLLAQLTELTKGLPPELQSIMIDMIIEATDLPQKDEIASRIRKATGQEENLEDLEPEERERVEKARQEQQELATRAQEAEVGTLEGKVEELRAKVEKILADAEKTRTEIPKVEAETEKIEAETEQIEEGEEAEAEKGIEDRFKKKIASPARKAA